MTRRYRKSDTVDDRNETCQIWLAGCANGDAREVSSCIACVVNENARRYACDAINVRRGQDHQCRSTTRSQKKERLDVLRMTQKERASPK